METAQTTQKGKLWFSFINGIKKLFANPTFRYVLKRVLSSLITLILIIAVVTALIRLIPDTKLYSISQYNKIKAQTGSDAIAERYKIKQLFLHGRVDINGNRIPVIQNILTFIYYVLPIYKEIPYGWDSYFVNVQATWKGFIYLGRSINEKKFVTDIISQRMGISFLISILTVFFTYLIGVPLGIAMSKKPGGIVDKIGTAFIVLNYAIP